MKNIFVKLLTLLLTASMVMSMMTSCFIEDFLETEAPETSETPQETTLGYDTKPNSPDESAEYTYTEPRETDPKNTPAPETSNKTPSATTGNGNRPNNTRPPETDPTWETPAHPETDPTWETPAETEYVDPDRPTEPSIEDGYMDGDAENWLFKIDQATDAIIMDGILEKAYYDGIYLVADIMKPASDSTFDLFMAADSENIYVFYEFTKVEGIFWDDNYDKKYQLDCADFCLNIAGKRARGTEFRIYAGVEGDETKAVYDASVNALGITDLYVKHTEKGYNVEFAIPLEKVVGMYENGDKMISFTAMSTITTSWDDKSVAPRRFYTVAMKAAGAEAKDDPTYLVVNGTAAEDAPEMTEDGRYKFTLNASAELLEDVSARAEAYANGLVFERKFHQGPEGLVNDKNDFMVTLVADPENIYVLFLVKDSNIVSNAHDPMVNAAASGSQYWWNDCAEIFWYNSATIKSNKYGQGMPDKNIRVWGATEGTNHYIESNAANDSMINAVSEGWLKQYTVKHTDGGYAVEYVISRDMATTDNAFSFLAQVTLGDIIVEGINGALDTYGRAYAMIDNAGAASGTAAREWANVIEIVDPTTPGGTVKPVETPAITTPAPTEPEETAMPSEPETEKAPLYVRPTASSKPTSTTARGNWIFEIEKSEKALKVDGVFDAAYEGGIVLLAERNLPASHNSGNYVDNESTLYVYATADDTNIYFFYVFVKDTDPKIFWDEEYTSKHHFDCADFVLNLGGAEAAGNEFLILGVVEGDRNTAMINGNLPTAAGVDNWYVKHTDYGYNVEFSIPLENVTGVDANGDKKISFTAMSTITLDWLEGSTTPTRTYTCTAKASTSMNEDKANPNILVVKGTADEDGPDRTDDGRYSYTLNAGKEALAVDGVKDEAYESGLVWAAKYDLPKDSQFAQWFTNLEANTFKVYMAADADYVYVLYEVLDEKIISQADASVFYRADCADIIISEAANATEGTGDDVRIFGSTEGGMGTAAAMGVANAPAIVDYHVKHTDVGYNVEIKIDRSVFTDKNVFSFLAVVTMCAGDKTLNNGGSVTVYPCIGNASGQGGNSAKGALNEVKIVDAK